MDTVTIKKTNLLPPMMLTAIHDLSNEAKIYLIHDLSESLLKSKPKRRTKVDDKAYTLKMVEKFFGKWEGDESPEEIIAQMNEGNSNAEPISFDV